MKKILASVLSLVMIMGLSVSAFADSHGLGSQGSGSAISSTPVGAITPVKMGCSDFETGTYRISIVDDSDNGYFLIEDSEGELKDFIIIVDDSYGYLYIDGDSSNVCYLMDVDYELVSKSDLGYSGYHVYDFETTERDYDPLEGFVEVDEVPSYGEYVDGVVVVDESQLDSSDYEAMFS